jgi:hypothetical protein
MTQNGSNFLNIPTQKGLRTAFVVIIVFMALAVLFRWQEPQRLPR